MRGYLERLQSEPLTQGIPVDENVRMIVVIPCYNEPDWQSTADSLRSCDPPDCKTEVFLLFNSIEKTPESIVLFNRKSYYEALHYSSVYNNDTLRFIPLLTENLPGNMPGAGLPRKIGMDEAVRRFEQIHCESGIIVSLDADCTVASNYLSEICREFESCRLCSATLEFHHPVGHLDVQNPLRKATEQYELYLRYYRAALEYVGYPYAYYTIGSALAVTAGTYVRAGGMGKQQAGEDFYFLQKVFPLGETRFIDTTCVFPAARLSDRVPFGTGPELARMIKSGETVKRTYCLESFELLKQLIDRTDRFYKSLPEDRERIVGELPIRVQSFLSENDFLRKVEEINLHTASLDSFRKRFFHYFNAFRILKFLNSVHPDPFELKEVEEEWYKITKLKAG